LGKSSQNSGRAQNAIISTTNVNLKVLKRTNKVKMYKNGFCKKVAQNIIIFGLHHCFKKHCEFLKVTQMSKIAKLIHTDADALIILFKAS